MLLIGKSSDMMEGVIESLMGLRLALMNDASRITREIPPVLPSAWNLFFVAKNH